MKLPPLFRGSLGNLRLLSPEWAVFWPVYPEGAGIQFLKLKIILLMKKTTYIRHRESAKCRQPKRRKKRPIIPLPRDNQLKLCRSVFQNSCSHSAYFPKRTIVLGLISSHHLTPFEEYLFCQQITMSTLSVAQRCSVVEYILIYLSASLWLYLTILISSVGSLF